MIQASGAELATDSLYTVPTVEDSSIRQGGLGTRRPTVSGGLCRAGKWTGLLVQLVVQLTFDGVVVFIMMIVLVILATAAGGAR